MEPIESNPPDRGGPPPLPRPAMVTVLGWIWIGLGGFMLVSSLMTLVIFVGMSDLMAEAPTVESVGQGFPGGAVLDWLFSHFQWIAWGQLALALFVVVAGVQLLRLRSWARTFLEGISWLGLIYMLVFGVWWAFVWTGMTGGIPEGAPDAPPAALMSAFGVAVMILAMLFYAVPTGALIYCLRHRTVRGAVSVRGRFGA